MKNAFHKYFMNPLFHIFLMLGFSVSQAMAAIDQTAVDAQFTSLTADISYLEDKAWPIVFMTVGISVAISLFKKFTKKAASG